MTIRSLILMAFFILPACTQTETTSHTEILDQYKAANIRLDRLAAPLLVGNKELCATTIDDPGIRWHQFSDYPEILQPVAKSYWNVQDDRSVFFVLADSLADKAGIKPGDRPDENTLMALAGQNTVCNIPVLVSFTDEINAYATGDEIIVTSGMLRAIDDDQYLTLVIAHELSHNILEHLTKEDGGDHEREADKTALLLLARAGLDFESAIAKRASVRAKIIGTDELPEDELERIADFKKAAKALKARIKAGEPLIP